MTEHKCNQTHEIWGPNEGCREFMDEPEAVVECGQPAVRVTIVRSFFPPDISLPEAEQVNSEVDVIFSCRNCSPTTDSTPYTEVLFSEILV